MSFTDRALAGRRLGRHLRTRLRDEADDIVVAALPRGGVPVAVQVAEALGAPLDILLVHKIGVPFQPEVAMGAVGDGGYVVLDERTVRWSGISPEDLERAKRHELELLEQRGAALRRGQPPLGLAGRTVVIVDDGAATGLTALAACHLARAAGAGRVVVAVPVASREAVAALETAADEVVALEVPRSFGAVGVWYRDFGQTSEAEVLRLLERVRAKPRGRTAPHDR